jgi:hypothetical protein
MVPDASRFSIALPGVQLLSPAWVAFPIFIDSAPPKLTSVFHFHLRPEHSLFLFFLFFLQMYVWLCMI